MMLMFADSRVVFLFLELCGGPWQCRRVPMAAVKLEPRKFQFQALTLFVLGGVKSRMCKVHPPTATNICRRQWRYC